MTPSIQVSKTLYGRLGKHSVGFETPADVVAKMVDFYEQGNGIVSSASPEPDNPTDLEFVYLPVNDVNHFKYLLLDHKRAYVKLYKTDGTSELHTWHAERFTVTSSVEGNLRSGYVRHWRAKGIFKVELSVNKDDLR